jgi:hypothetical protein
MIKRWAEVCKTLMDEGFIVWNMQVALKRDGSVEIFLPKVVFTDKPGDPWEGGPGDKSKRRAAYRAAARKLGVPGLYPTECVH